MIASFAQVAKTIPRWDLSIAKFVKKRTTKFNLYPIFLKDGIVISAGGHVIIIILLLIAPHINLGYKPFRPKDNIITVDLSNLIIPPDVRIERETVIPKQVAKPAPAPTPKAAPAPTPTAAPAPKPAPKAEPAPAPKPMVATPEKEVPLPKMTEEEVKKTLQEVEAAPRRNPLDDILSSVNQIRQERQQVKRGIEAEEAAPVRPAASEAGVEQNPNQSAGDQLRNHFALSYIDAVRLKLRSCWNIDPGIKGHKDMKIVIRTAMTEDGNIASLSILNAREFGDDPWFRAAAASARRALLTCAPYTNLPRDLHHEWKDIVFTFYPSGEIR